MSSTTFKSFNTTTDVIVGNPRAETFPIWSDIPSDNDTLNQSVINTYYTNSGAIGMKSAEANYFWNIYNLDYQANSSARPQFSITFGTTASFTLLSGSAWESNDADLYTYPSYAVYRQLVNVLTNGGSGTNWTYVNEIGQTITPGNVYIISIARSQLKDYIEPRNVATGISTWQLNLSSSRGLINLTCGPASSSNQTAYSIIFNTGSLYTGAVGSYLGGGKNTVFGRFYSDKGLFVLDGDRLFTSGALAISPTQSMGVSSGAYIPSGSLVNFYNSIVLGAYFKARSVQKVQSTNYFVRALNNEFNYSNNPTWTTGSNNQIVAQFYENQITYISAVGLYDGDPSSEGSGQLVAIAKLSKPIQKTSDSEALIRVRLDF